MPTEQNNQNTYIKLNNKQKKYDSIDIKLMELFYGFSCDTPNATITFSNQNDIRKFAFSHLVKPFYEPERQFSQHFRIYALANGISSGDLVNWMSDPNSPEGLETAKNIKELRTGFINLCDSKSIDEIANMYTSFAKAVQADIMAEYPVREPIRAQYDPFPQAPDFKYSDDDDPERTFAFKSYNNLVYQVKKKEWMSLSLNKFLFEGTTFAPDPDEPDLKITLQGKKECMDMFKKYKMHPFNELTRHSEVHLLAFCINEGLTKNDIIDYFQNPDSRSTQKTRQKMEQARTKLFETAICDNEEISMNRLKDFYKDYSVHMYDAVKEFLRKGDYSIPAQIEFTADFDDLQSLTVQTLKRHGVIDHIPTVYDAINTNFKARGIDINMSQLTSLSDRIAYGNQTSSDNLKFYIDPSKPIEDTKINFSSFINIKNSLGIEIYNNSTPEEFGENAINIRDYCLQVKLSQNLLYDLPNNTTGIPSDLYRVISNNLNSDSAIDAHTNELQSTMKNPKETMNTLMKELKQWDSGFLKWRGSPKFKDLRKAINTLEKSILSSPQEPDISKCHELAEKFEEVSKLAKTYLQDKTKVDRNANTNAGHRKDLAEKFKQFADLGKAVYYGKEYTLQQKHIRLTISHNRFAKSNNITAGFEPKKITPIQFSEKLTTFLNDIEGQKDALWKEFHGDKEKNSKEKTPIEQIYTAAFGAVREIIKLNNLKAPNFDKLKRQDDTYLSRIVAYNLIMRERELGQKNSGPIADIINKKGAREYVDIINKSPAMVSFKKNLTSDSLKEFINDRGNTLAKAVTTPKAEKTVKTEVPTVLKEKANIIK